MQQITDKRLISLIYKRTLQINKKTDTTTSIEKRQKSIS